MKEIGEVCEIMKIMKRGEFSHQELRSNIICNCNTAVNIPTRMGTYTAQLDNYANRKNRYLKIRAPSRDYIILIKGSMRKCVNHIDVRQYSSYDIRRYDCSS